MRFLGLNQRVCFDLRLLISAAPNHIRQGLEYDIDSVCTPNSTDRDKINSLFSSRTLLIEIAEFLLTL